MNAGFVPQAYFLADGVVSFDIPVDMAVEGKGAEFWLSFSPV